MHLLSCAAHITSKCKLAHTAWLRQMLFIFYYIDTSVLLENILLVKFIKTTSGTRVVYFPYIGKYFLIIGNNFLYVKALKGNFYIFNEFVSLALDKISLEKYISCTTGHEKDFRTKWSVFSSLLNTV